MYCAKVHVSIKSGSDLYEGMATRTSTYSFAHGWWRFESRVGFLWGWVLCLDEFVTVWRYDGVTLHASFQRV